MTIGAVNIGGGIPTGSAVAAEADEGVAAIPGLAAAAPVNPAVAVHAGLVTGGDTNVAAGTGREEGAGPAATGTARSRFAVRIMV